MVMDRASRRVLRDDAALVAAEESKEPYAVYILELTDSSLYVGMTRNIKRRLREHGSSNKRRFVAKVGARRLLYQETLSDKVSAEERERQLKRWSRAKKMALIEGDTERLKKLSKCRSYSGIVQR